MIHRINSVAPDLDDRVIKPNQARSAANLRFGASVDDSNLSGGILVNGMSMLDFNPNTVFPDGSVTESFVVGDKEDYENGFLYSAIYSFAGRTNANHSIVRINIATDKIEYVVRGAWLNFTKSCNVSMTIIDGLLYWTDGINEPRMVNIEKGIRTFNGVPTSSDIYPFPNEFNLWCFSQIKRSPQERLIVFITDNTNPPIDATGAGYWFTTDMIPGYANKNWVSEIPYQFSYYYIYDNNEESRLAPWSNNVFFTRNILLSVGVNELQNYCNPQSQTIVKFVVFVMRNGNDGLVYNIKKFNVDDFVFTSTTSVPSTLPILNIDRIDSIDKTPTPSSVYDQRYDSVPLISGTNEIANNILNHANIINDYGDFGSIKIASAIAKKVNNVGEFFQQYTPEQTPQRIFKTFRPDSSYTVGFQLIDEYGRSSPVLNTTTVKIPAPIINSVQALDTPGTDVRYANGLNPTTYNDDLYNNQYNISVSLEGAVPSWAKYIRLAYTRNNTVNFFHKTICRIYYWYQEKSGANIMVRTNDDSTQFRNNASELQSLKDENNDNTIYTFKGYGVELSSNVPFLYNADEQQYLKIAREYYKLSDPIENTGSISEAIEYRIVGQTGSILLIEEDIKSIKFYSAYTIGETAQIGSGLPLWYQVELYSKKQIQETIFYDSDVNILTSEYLANNNSYTGDIKGDCYMAYFKKTFTPQSNKPFRIKVGYKLTQDDVSIDGGYTVNGYFYSMNLTNIYSEKWQSDIGLENIAQGPNYKQNILKTSIAFSNQYIKGTLINGLNKFNPLDIRQAPAENGPITALVVTNATQQEPGVMLAVGSLGISSFYYGAIQLTNVDGSSNLATTDQHLASQRPLLGQFGTSQPASITKTPLSTVYWWSDVVNDFIRYTNAGLERLGLTYSFNNKLRQKAAGKRVITGYDQVMDEAILIPDKDDSFVFSERFKSFQGYREYFNSSGQTPERVVGMSVKTYFFLNGFVYVSKVDSERNIFFDRVAQPKLTLVTNEFPSVVKQWNSIKVYGPKPEQTNLEVGSSEGYFLASIIKPSWWIKRKGEYDAAVRRAVSGDGDGLSGKVMESRILYSTFVFDATTFDKLNFIEVKSNTAIVQ